MKHSHGEDSYNLTEEIAVRAVFRTVRPNYLADHFNTAFSELSGDVYAQARLVDIALRFGNNLSLNLAAARKIRGLLDEHKILMIPAYIESSTPEITGIIAAAIPTIHDPDPRRYFLERWMHHEHPEVARICREALADCPPESMTLYAARPERNPVQAAGRPAIPPGAQQAGMASAQAEERKIGQKLARKNTETDARPAGAAGKKTASHAKVKKAETKRVELHSSSVSTRRPPIQAQRPKTDASVPRSHSAPAAAYRTVSGAESDSFGYEKLIALIGLHITDPRPEVRLKWVKLIGHIPERLDPEDEHKMRFISFGLADPVQEICLEAIAQIEFLIHDRSKLALLLKIIDTKSPLIRSKEARAAIGTLAADSRKLIENRASLAENAKPGETPKRRRSPLTDGGSEAAKQNGITLSPKKIESSASVASERASQPDMNPEKPEKSPAGEIRADAGNFATAKTDETLAQATDTNGIKPENTPIYPEEVKAELTEIVEELDLPPEALAELEKENTPSSLFIKEIAPLKTVSRGDNYFLRHSAVLHIKNIHEEELRFELYQTVLKHDPKDLVRQIAVEEARNLRREHVRPILRLGLEDPAWQVRSDALEYLLPILSDAEEESRILRDCVNDSDYHIRQKADEKLLTLSRRSVTRRFSPQSGIRKR